MNSLKLIAAIAYIKLNILKEDEIMTMIEFEDGSGYKFNYKSFSKGNRTRTHYIDLNGKI